MSDNAKNWIPKWWHVIAGMAIVLSIAITALAQVQSNKADIDKLLANAPAEREAIVRLEEQVGDLKDDVNDLKDGMKAVQNNMQSVSTDVSEIRAMIRVLYRQHGSSGMGAPAPAAIGSDNARRQP